MHISVTGIPSTRGCLHILTACNITITNFRFIQHTNPPCTLIPTLAQHPHPTVYL